MYSVANMQAINVALMRLMIYGKTKLPKTFSEDPLLLDLVDTIARRSSGEVSNGLGGRYLLQTLRDGEFELFKRCVTTTLTNIHKFHYGMPFMCAEHDGWTSPETQVEALGGSMRDPVDFKPINLAFLLSDTSDIIRNSSNLAS